MFFCLFVSVADESNVGSLAGTTAGETTAQCHRQKDWNRHIYTFPWVTCWRPVLRWNVTPCEDPVVKDSMAPLQILTDNQAGSIERKLLPYSKENKQFYLKTARNWAKEVKRPFSKSKVYMFKYILNLGKPSKIGAWLFYVYIAFLLASYHCAWKREKLTSSPGSCVYITAYWSWSW